ncbi:AAA family ATPase, partial [Luteolibacter marinus]|uniref:AAA family ATPase n=1 Tax=Luteolibacter marinus TaxID=2776705 RepID=UPI00186919C5
MPGTETTPAVQGWEIWQNLEDGSCSRLPGTAPEDADLLKVLLANAVRALTEKPEALLALRSGRGGDDEPAERLLAGLAAMGLDGLIMDERSAGLLPPPYRTERIGFLPGILAEPFCAHRLEIEQAPAASVTPPARGQLWEEILRTIDHGDSPQRFQQVSIAGPAGAGKSHVINATAAWLAARGTSVARVSCLPSDVPGTFAPWRSLLAQTGGDGLAAAASDFGAELTLDPILVKNLVEFLAGSGLTDGEGDGGLSPLQYKDILPEFIAAVLVRLTTGKTTALVIDDIQWMDEGSHEVLEALNRAEPPLLVVLGRRGQPATGDLALGPMSPEEHRKLLAELSGYEEITDGLNSEIHRISGGLPLVSREAFAVMGKRRRLLNMGRTLDLAPAAKGTGGTRDQREMALTERFRDLSPRLRTLLGACAIWREPFSREQAKTTTIACHPDIDFAECWESSLLGEFIVAAPGVPGKFAFYHDLLREAALSLMGDRERAVGHGAALEWMTAQPPKSISPAEAGFHARESGRDAIAV